MSCLPARVSWANEPRRSSGQVRRTTNPWSWSRSTARVSPLGVRERLGGEFAHTQLVSLAAGQPDEDVEGLGGVDARLLQLAAEDPPEAGG